MPENDFFKNFFLLIGPFSKPIACFFFNNFIANVNGNRIHFIKEKGSGKNPKPLLILHGWPGSFIEFLSIIEKLAHPERFGGNKEDGFDVIVPSLPGFGFSGIPKKPIGPKKIAKTIY